VSVQNRTGLPSQAPSPVQRRLGLALLVIATVAAALTDGYVAGLLAGAVLFTAGAVVAICTVNARISPAEAAAR
jgi:hypothetical protein